MSYLALLLQVAARFEKLLEVGTPGGEVGWTLSGPALTCPKRKAAPGILSSAVAGAGVGMSHPQFLGMVVESWHCDMHWNGAVQFALPPPRPSVL